MKDKRKKLDGRQIYQMNLMAKAGKSLKVIAEKYGVTTYTVKYHTNSEFNASEKARKKVA